MTIVKHIAHGLAQKIRLSDYVHVAFPHLISRKAGQKALKKGNVTINGKLGHSSIWVENGAEIFLHTEEQPLPKSFCDIEVVFEDDHFAVIVKPAGINVSGNRNALAHYYHSFLKPTTEIDRVYPYTNVHRLDRDTKGLLIIAKTKRCQIKLQKQFLSRSINKIYHAVVIGKLVPPVGSIDIPIENKPAITHYQILESVKSKRFGYLSLVKVSLDSGRTHQIRIHFSRKDCPIVGDKIYNKFKPIGNGKGMFLFATGLSFCHPIYGSQIKLNMEVPPKVKRLMNGH